MYRLRIRVDEHHVNKDTLYFVPNDDDLQALRSKAE